jgi:peptide/nickel transport system ATP-binding protein
MVVVMVDIDQLRVVFREGDHGLLALDGVGLQLRPGRVVGLVGESGSGKTTLGRAMMGLLPPNGAVEGSIRLGDRELIGLDEGSFNTLRWTKVAMVFQNGAANLNPVHRIVDQVAEPSFVVADEPTNALDPGIQARIMKMLLDLQIEKGLTLLFVTHDLGLARKIADRIGVMLSGRLVEIGPAARVMGCPVHPYTRFLMESARGQRKACGPVPDGNLSAGCSFVQHCDRAAERCRHEPPPPVDVDGHGQTASCYNPLNARVPERTGPAANGCGQPHFPLQPDHCGLEHGTLRRATQSKSR